MNNVKCNYCNSDSYCRILVYTFLTPACKACADLFIDGVNNGYSNGVRDSIKKIKDTLRQNGVSEEVIDKI